jgi:15-cis-phytoene synthase
VRSDVRGRLLEAWESLDLGPGGTKVIGGQLLRPRLALAAAGSDRLSDGSDEAFWLAMLAVQLAHEASLLHDDVVDDSQMRRGRPTLVSRQGVGAALVEGDQLLARAYIAAARTESWTFVHRFTRAIDATIAGERAQGAAAGRRLDAVRMREIAMAKSGELFGCAISAAAALQDRPEAEELAEVGRDVGILYQKVDDLLDYCPGAGTGKPPFADFSGGLWTWPRTWLPEGSGPEGFFRDSGGAVPAIGALEELEGEWRTLVSRVRTRLPHADELVETLDRWIDRARTAVRSELSEGGAVPAGGSGEEVPLIVDAPAILARHGRSFHFATRIMPPSVRGRVARVYAFCRTIDDAVDRAPDTLTAERSLRGLLAAAREAYHGEDPREAPPDHPSRNGTRPRHHRMDPEDSGSGMGGDPLREAMREMREANVDFALVEELCEGVRMDLRPRTFRDLDDLRVYTHRVAGVVGIWIAGLAGCRDEWALTLAAELGHAMQLTNIARDVGEDLEMGRVYLPADLMARHGISEASLRAAALKGGPVPPGLAAALEELMGWADAGYGAAFQAIPYLPSEYRRSVAVAARVYQGIHEAIRRNGYDTLRNRARTGRVDKLLLGFSSLRELARAEARVAG